MGSRKVNIQSFDKAYFLGVGGIGMSALARYFNTRGFNVAGYDKTQSPLTDVLSEEGVAIHFEDLGAEIPADYLDNEKVLIVYTPAIPDDMQELNYFISHGFTVLKRAEVLGLITRNSKALGVAGTHGKTTTSTMLAHILNESTVGCNAFLGGIATNFNSNFVAHKTSEWTVIEADEFDRSFLQLSPFASIVTSTDADHLDIYGDNELFLDGFKQYIELINPAGFTIMQASIDLPATNKITYGLDVDADFVGSNLRLDNDVFLMDVKSKLGEWNNVELGVPGTHNAENALACIALCVQLELTEEEIRSALKSFAGVKRRFEYHVRSEKLIYIDDYAHHPTEINALLDSIALLYPGKKVTGVFQPHLFSRTRDFFAEFTRAISRLDEAILLPIYPARELPIEGITSDALLADVSSSSKHVMSPNDALEFLSTISEGVVLTIGAGDIDRIVPELKQRLSVK
ncbi:MAG: UDP-N-acetylmuramate--alanine ligase [Flavobacteriaceae bacterium]